MTLFLKKYLFHDSFKLFRMFPFSLNLLSVNKIHHSIVTITTCNFIFGNKCHVSSINQYSTIVWPVECGNCDSQCVIWTSKPHLCGVIARIWVQKLREKRASFNPGMDKENTVTQSVNKMRDYPIEKTYYLPVHSLEVARNNFLGTNLFISD